VTYSECHALLSQFGVLSRLMMIGLSPFALAEFETVEAAIAARTALDGFEWSENSARKTRVLFVEYAQMDASVFFGDEQHRLQLPNASPLEKISPVSVCKLEQLPQVLSSGQLEQGVVSGLLLVHDFMSEAEEVEMMKVSCTRYVHARSGRSRSIAIGSHRCHLLRVSNVVQFLNSQPWSDVKRRRVQHYGFEFNYRVNDIDRQAPLTEGQGIPPPFHAIMERMKVLGTLDKQQREEQAENACAPLPSAASSAPPPPLDYVPNQLTVNCYEPGHGIPPHVDTHSAFTDIIISISLGSTIVMELLPTPSAQFLLNLPDQPVNIVLPPRSLLCLSGVSRYGYTHAIIPRRTDRINNVLTTRQQRTSLTFRQLRQMHTSARPRCRCAFTSACDTKEMHTTSEANAPEIL
jgi:hypothetical protein